MDEANREVYIPTWRAACDAWVSKNVEDKTGVHTPLFRLYNAYIKDNPDHYMDIGQFGKVLKSRFPFRRRRRGKHRHQVYVYQDVALKSELEKADEKGAGANETVVSRVYNPSTLPTVNTAGPSILVGNIAGGWLVSSSQPETDLPSPRASSVKREGDTSHLQSPKRYKASSDERSATSAKQQSEQDKASSGDKKYANTSLCRMAIGRRWIDANLVDMPGHHTYANDICQAYNEDHPDEPLTFTSFALLIRSKYPGRRKKMAYANETKYVYEDLKLRGPQERRASEVYTIKRASSPQSVQNVSEKGSLSSSPRLPEQNVRDSTTTASAPAINYILPPGISPENLHFGTLGAQLPVVSVAGNAFNIPSVVNEVPHNLDVQIEKVNRKSPVQIKNVGERKNLVKKEAPGSPTSKLSMTGEQEGPGMNLVMEKNIIQASTRLMHEQQTPVEFNVPSSMYSNYYPLSDSDTYNNPIDPAFTVNTSMNSMSLAENSRYVPSISKEVSGSPTSSSPPGPAIYRLEEEIITSSPQVAQTLDLSCSSGASASTSKVDQKMTKKSKVSFESQYKGLLKSIISTARGILENEEPISATAYERKIEKTLIEENPAVSYNESETMDHFPCNIAPALKILELSTPEVITGLVDHHQSCVGLGCCSECRTLRAAYIHICIFQHRCDIWNSFYKIIGKHSKRCRQVSCGVEFCHFVKHELHLNGTSVLPMQLLKERWTLEEEFKKCKELGSHDGSLHCCHLPSPKLPVMSLPTKHHGSGKIAEDRENAIANDNKLLKILTRTIVSSYPDTPSGNALGTLLARTAKLLKEMFD